MNKLKCAIIGATGVAGQQFVVGLQDHPWFEISHLFASERSAGKLYKDVAVWHEEGSHPENVAGMTVLSCDDIEKYADQIDIFFSALPSDAAKEMEARCATLKPTISTASAYRMEEDVPLLLPEVNADSVALIKEQQESRGWKGFVVPGPNCTVVGLAVAVKPIADKFGLKRVIITSMQALSGAGYPGVPSMEILDNIVPYIDKEEPKVKQELLKMIPGDYKVGCTCTRVNVSDGHTEAVTVETEKPCTVEEVKQAISEFNERCSERFGELPSMPKQAIIVKEEVDRPQPRRDKMAGDGMSTVMGRLRNEDIFDNGVSFVMLSHNTKKGAALGEILAAELLYKQGYIV